MLKIQTLDPTLRWDPLFRFGLLLRVKVIKSQGMENWKEHPSRSHGTVETQGQPEFLPTRQPAGRRERHM